MFRGNTQQVDTFELKPNQRFICGRCHHRTKLWEAKCPSCFRINTMKLVTLRGIEKRIPDSDDDTVLAMFDDDGNEIIEDDHDAEDEALETDDAPKAFIASEVKFKRHKKILTGIVGLDKVFGGGIVKGACIGMTGDPGAGKSTIILQAMLKLARKKIRVMQIDAEEPKENIIDRARNIGATDEDLKYLIIYDAGGFIEDGLALADQHQPDVVCVNSVNEFYAKDPMGNPIETECGNPLQMKRIARLLFRSAHKMKRTTFVVCQVNAEGDMTGPKAVLHQMDAAFKLTKDESYQVKNSPGFQRVHFQAEKDKNRFGSTALKQCFRWTSSGYLAECEDD